MPSEVAFADLIDSTLNLIDDGFEKTVEDGLKVSQLGDGKLMSFYQNMSTLSSMWFVGIDKATANLSFGNPSNPHVLTLRSIDPADSGSASAAKMGVGINTAAPRLNSMLPERLRLMAGLGSAENLPFPLMATGTISPKC